MTERKKVIVRSSVPPEPIPRAAPVMPIAKRVRKSKQAEMMRVTGYITPAEAAKKIGVFVTSIYHQMDKGVLAGTRVGDRRYVELKSLIAFVGVDKAKLFGLMPKDASKKEEPKAP